MHSFWAFIHRRYYRYNFLRRLLSLWILKVVCFFVLTSTIQAQAPQTVVFGSDAPLTTLQFGLQTEYLSDPTYSLTITSFIHHPPAATGGFIPSPALNPNLGFQNANIWMRFNLKRQAVQSDNHSPHQWFVSLPTMRNIDTVEIYLIREKSIVFADTAGYSVTYRRWTVSSPYIVFPLPLSPGDSVCCYVRFRLQGIFLLRPSLQTAESLQQTQYTLGTDVYTFYGIATFALLYNILLFFLIRSKFYAFYIIYVITITVHISLIVGYFYQTVTPNLPGIQPRLLLLFTLITNIINVVFVQEFLKERRGILLPKFWDHIIFIYVVGSLGCICAEFLGMRSVAVYGSFYWSQTVKFKTTDF